MISPLQQSVEWRKWTRNGIAWYRAAMAGSTTIPMRFMAAETGAVEGASEVLEGGSTANLVFSNPPASTKLLRRINDLCLEYGERLSVQFCLHRGKTFDFDVLDSIPHVASLSAHGLQSACNYEALSRLTRLTRLWFGVHECPATHLLDLLDPEAIQHLALGANKSRNFDLHRLEEFQRLQSLFIGGHTKGIDSLIGLRSLESLRLWSIPKKQDLAFVGTLPRLRSLELTHGGREDISEIRSESIEEIEIARIRTFSRFPSLSDLPALRSLRIENQPRLTRVEIESETSGLAKLAISECKGLVRLSGLEKLQKLEELTLFRTGVEVDDLLSCPLPQALRVVRFFTGSERRDAQVRARLDAHGYEES